MGFLFKVRSRRSSGRGQLWVALCFLIVGCASVRPRLVSGLEPAAERTIFRDVHLFSAASVQSELHQDVWVRGGLIEAVHPTGASPWPEGAVVVEGRGMTLMPGLIDLHVHTSASSGPPWELFLPDPQSTVEAMLYAGITTAADMGGPNRASAERREALRSGRLLGPRLLISGMPFTAKGGHPIALLELFTPWPVGALIKGDWGFEVESPASVDLAFEELLQVSPDYVKLICDEIPLSIPVLSLGIARSVVNRAHAARKKAMAHVGDDGSMRVMADAGVDIFVHGAYRGPILEETAALIAERHIAVAPTLGIFEDFDRLAHGDLQPSQLVHEVADPRILQSLRHRPQGYQPPLAFQSWVAAVHRSRQTKLDNVAVLRRHGVTILVGSDSPNAGHFAGAALHQELESLVQAGMTPAEVLRAVTLQNAQALGLEREVGSVEVGKRADLLLVRGNPLESIVATQDIDSVYLGGRRVVREVPARRP